MSLELTVGAASKTGTLQLTDDVDSSVVAATFANTTAASDSGAVSVVVNEDQSVSISPVAEGSATVSGSTSATYVNSLGATVTETKSFTTAVLVIAAPPVAHTTSASLVFPQ